MAFECKVSKSAFELLNPELVNVEVTTNAL